MNNDFMKIVYHTPNYTPFNFYPEYSEICRKFEYAPVMSDGYAITVSNVDLPHFDTMPSVHESSILKKHHLSVLKSTDSSMNSSMVIDEFRQLLLKLMLAWEERYISMITGHFKERMSENRLLNSHNSIKIQVGNIVADISNTAEIIKNKHLFVLACDNIKNIAMSLHKISGGRAFLEENIVEMLCLFEIFRKIYFIRKSS